NAEQVAKELVEKAKQAEQSARQAAIAAAKAQAAVRLAEQSESLMKSDSELGGVPRSEQFVGRWRIGSARPTARPGEHCPDSTADEPAAVVRSGVFRVEVRGRRTIRHGLLRAPVR